jgi:hypothetical protein
VLPLPVGAERLWLDLVTKPDMPTPSMPVDGPHAGIRGRNVGKTDPQEAESRSRPGRPASRDEVPDQGSRMARVKIASRVVVDISTKEIR